ncbi:MAG: hypothetical protein B7Z41_08060 [Rhizobiales bacterium 12-66-7]|nr:MAG: hypothetical protein B7Z41_08060 [Rhizobiales bacterium 12-66-7]
MLAAPTLTVRHADEADLPAVLALYAQHYVAEAGGVVVGSFALLIMINLGHLGAPSAIVEDVVVAPDMQGAGIGREMMRVAMAHAAEKGCYKLVLSSNQKRARAHAFYEQLGFARHGLSFHIELAGEDA